MKAFEVLTALELHCINTDVYDVRNTHDWYHHI